MHRIVYVSEASHEMSEADLNQIVEASRRNNGRADTTGVLIYHEGRFFQVLEGHPQLLRSCFQRISMDRRHHGVAIIEQMRVTERAFPKWRMGYSRTEDLKPDLRNNLFSIYDLIPPNSPDRGDDPKVRAQLRAFLAGFANFHRPRAV